MHQFAPHIIVIELVRPDDVAPRIKQLTPSAATLLGYGEQELIGKPVDLIYAAGNDKALWQEALADATDKNTRQSPSARLRTGFACEIVTKANDKIQVLISLSVLSNPTPNKTDIALLIQDKPVLSEVEDFSVESAFTESEERFRQMAEMAGEWLWEQDPEGYYSYSSAAVSQILGYSPDEVQGKHYTEFLTPQDKATQQHYATSHRPFYALLSHYRHKDGRQILTESTGLPIINAAGKLLKWRGVDRDITARMHFQDALIESEKRIRLIIESSLSAIVIMDSYGIVTDWNHPAEKIFGWTKDEAIGRRLDELVIPPRLHAAHRRGLEHFLHTGSGPLLNRLIEQTAIRRDGTEFPVELSISPLKLGNAYIFSGFIHDITERKRLEHRFRQAVESAPNAIVMVNKSGTIVMVNAQTEAFFGYSRAELIGQPVEILVPKRFRNAHVGVRQAYLATPVSRPMGAGQDLYGLRKDGTEFPVEIGLSLIDSKEETLVLSTIVDITTRKATEAAIRQAQINLAIAQSEIKIAQRIQASLSPSAPIKSNHFEVTGYCLPADQVGGDYFDYFYRNEDHLDMIIADVSGHSIGPALFMVETRSAIRTQANGSGTPAETLKVLNNFLFEDLDRSDYFITLFYLQYNITNHQLSFANAGHPPPLLLSLFQSECRELDADGLILGVNKNVVFEEKTTTLSQGDLILLYTDGLTEAENADGEFFGLKRVNDILVQHALKSPQAIIEALLEQLKQFCRSESFNDDITLMIFKRH
ncbi:PAS domain S-box protein [Methylobacter tundripaludum]|uniref:Putative PAS/PAC sensor protein n=1 Tax=Methylobacter tundripaludum (strain ATCC BAA-1195 / DSM 17260 / SV96) TaxID=697282 RepID=G3IR99_METTV|nr:PAS domain S-box protein [Methylobacter tundripaludum]EGW22110.1 putative PAS/PAC sensor protein [Methylobacter tundripaludum SV96]